MASIDTQYKTTAPVDECKRDATYAAQWLLEAKADQVAPVFQANNLDLFICGEDAFKQIAADLKKAKSSVEIICWGFDPAMELIRTGTTWPRGDTWGDLLRDVALGKYNGGKPVQVRLLSWYGHLGSTTFGTNNMPGYSNDRLTYEQKMAMAQASAGEVGYFANSPIMQPQSTQDKREDFNAQWYEDAFTGRLPNLFIRTRDGKVGAVDDSLKEEPGERDLIEVAGLEVLATDHQKTILIDYEYQDGLDAVGYVMGLNSVTDYWDTQQHLFYDPRRGELWEGSTESGAGLKPYQDYACRVRGEALVAVSKNFTDAWNRAKGKGSNLSRVHDLKSPPSGLVKTLSGTTQRAQIVRTQPEEKEKTIKRLYDQAASFALNYIYIENQYFQYTDWAISLKKNREGYLDGWQAGCKSLKDLPNLHVMIVIPTPERAQMVPRTYDTVKALGQADSMPNQDRAIEDELKRNRAQQRSWQEHCAQAEKAGVMPDPDNAPVPLSAGAKSAQELGSKEEIAKAMSALGMRSIVGSLWSFNPASLTADLFSHSPFPIAKEVRDNFKVDSYREIYIHSKLMVIDDSFLTIGSANLNLRSMAVDAEINIATDNVGKSKDLRRRVWNLHTGKSAGCDGGEGSQQEIASTFMQWKILMQKNLVAKSARAAIAGFLVPFVDTRTSFFRFS